MSQIEQFKEYLEKVNDLSDELRRQYSLCAETTLVNVIRIVEPEFSDVWDEKYGVAYYDDMRKQLVHHKADIQDFNTVVQTLKQISSFLERQKAKAGKGSTKKKHTKTPKPPRIPKKELEEGHLMEVHLDKRERNPEARQQCFDYYWNKYGGKIICECCGIDFNEVYGKIGLGFIEVHHLDPISNYDETHKIDPVNDLVPLCSNCHSMIHRLIKKEDIKGKPSLEKLKELMLAQKK